MSDIAGLRDLINSDKAARSELYGFVRVSYPMLKSVVDEAPNIAEPHPWLNNLREYVRWLDNGEPLPHVKLILEPLIKLESDCIECIRMFELRFQHFLLKETNEITLWL